MPSRMPIIPTSQSNQMLLRALHHEMKEKDFLNNNNQIASHSTDLSEKSLKENSRKEKFEQKSDMPQHIIEAASGNQKWEAMQSDSSSGGNTDDSDDNNDSNQSEQSCSSIDYDVADEVEQKHHQWSKEDVRYNANREDRNTKIFETRNRLTTKKNVAAKPQKIELSDRDKEQIREGYHRYVVNGERPPTGTSFGAKLSAFHRQTGETSNKFADENTESDEIFFPLEEAAAGKTDKIALKDVMKIEKATKRKTKLEKQAIAEAKLSVSEAKLNEFEAKLRARQARIDERHAKLCYRRAIIKRAEERLQLLESRLDDEEECHRERERRVKNRERRVKQEEAGIQIKEVSLKKRETKITEDLKDIESRKRLVEEKEKMSKTMEEIMTKREDLHRQQVEKKNRISSTMPFIRLLRKPAYKSGNTAYGAAQTKKESSSPEQILKSTDLSSSGSGGPIPSPRKSLNSNGEGSRLKCRSNSLNSMLSDEVSSKTKEKNKDKTEKINAGSLPRSQDKNSIAGLWL